MQKGHWIIVGTVGPLSIIGILIFIYGWCIVTFCETQIEITSFEIPEEIPWNSKIEADFIITNTGEMTAKNCKLRWKAGAMVYTNSDIFSLSPQEVIKLHLISSDIFRPQSSTACFGSSGEMKTYQSDAWVFCENSDSGRSRIHFEQLCP